MESGSYKDRHERLNAAQAKYEEVMTYPGPKPLKPYYEAGVVGFVFGEMWTGTALSRRDRRWATLACVGLVGAAIPIQTHIYAALKSGDCTLDELEEFNLFFATQSGWPRAQVIDQYIEAAAEQLGLQRKEFALWAEPCEPSVRTERARVAYENVMCAPAPALDTKFRRLGYMDYLYGEVWTRPVLSRRERRIVALCCSAVIGTEAELHADAALQSGDLTLNELQELVLHYAVYCGWQSAAVLDDVILNAAERFDRATSASPS